MIRMAAVNGEGDRSPSREKSSSTTSTSQVIDRDSGFEWPVDLDDAERQKPFLEKQFPEKRQGLTTGFAKERNLHLRMAVPTDSDYESDGSEFSFPGTPTTSTPGRIGRWKSFKISSFFSRFQRQSTMPNRPRIPDSPLQETCRSHDDVLTRESRTFMVPYDSLTDNTAASPQKVISIRGLIKLCGQDTCGRPIVVIDTSYCPPANMRFVALGHIREKMDPVVESGEYNVVFVMSPNPTKRDASEDMPTMWCLEVYRKLPYAYKKNVQRVVFIHPTFIVNLVLKLLRPFMSSKAHEKIIRVHRLADLDKTNNGDISLDMLYLASHVYLHDKALAAAENPGVIIES